MPSLEELGRLVGEKRKGRGVREVAREIGISHATLLRVEKGHLPDIENYKKICRWIGIDEGSVVSIPKPVQGRPMAEVHFRKARTVSPKTAQALAQMILTAQEILLSKKP